MTLNCLKKEREEGFRVIIELKLLEEGFRMLSDPKLLVKEREEGFRMIIEPKLVEELLVRLLVEAGPILHLRFSSFSPGDCSILGLFPALGFFQPQAAVGHGGHFPAPGRFPCKDVSLTRAFPVKGCFPPWAFHPLRAPPTLHSLAFSLPFTSLSVI